MKHARLIAATVLLAACARATGPSGPPMAAPSPSPESEGIRFVLEDTYEVGETVPVRVENLGPVSYLYNVEYQACDLTYRDETGREFIIPPGTHCDLIMIAEIKPGETLTLFRWDLDECVKDDWGCVESEPLPPGEYTISGRFERSGGDDPDDEVYAPEGTGQRDRVSATFTIVEPRSA